MKESSKQQETFYVRWEERRKKKWRFVIIKSFRHTIFGLSVILVVILWIGKFKTDNLHLLNLLFLPLLFLIFGIFKGLRDFKRNEKQYLDILNEKDADEQLIIKGIQSLKAGNAWSFESLTIKEETDKSLLIQNKLFWFDENAPSSEKLEECFQAVYGDFQRLQ